MIIWLTILGMALTAYATRALPLLARWRAPHPLARRALAYVPPAIMAALVVPALVAPSDVPQVGRHLWAGLVGAIVAWRTLNLPLTIGAALASFAAIGVVAGG